LLVVGEAGIGKSRFLHEILRRTRRRRTRILLFQCSPRGMDLALAPLVDVVRYAAGVAEGEDLTINEVAGLMRREGIRDDFVVQMIAFAAGAAVPSEQIAGEASPGRIRARMNSATRRCIEEWSKAGPIVIAVEDVQWIDPTSADLLHDLVGWIAGKPVFLLFTTRKRLG
jgi:predicted ATPase